ASVRYTLLRAPHDWTLTEETSISAHRGVSRWIPLAPRIEELPTGCCLRTARRCAEGSDDADHDSSTLAASPPTWLSCWTQRARLREIHSEVGTSAPMSTRGSLQEGHQGPRWMVSAPRW